MTGRKHSHRRRRNKRRARRNNAQDTLAGSISYNTNETGHSCLSYAQLMSDNAIMDGEIVEKLKAEILHLKQNLITTHVELAELTNRNDEFKISLEKCKQKMNVLSLVAFGSVSKSSEPDQEKGEGKSEMKPNEKKIPAEKTPTPSTSTCQCAKQKAASESEDQSDDDDDSETT